MAPNQLKKCNFFNRGYCKNGNNCSHKHPDKVCENANCSNINCDKRHPYLCKYGLKCTFLRKNICLYAHKVISNSDENVEDKFTSKISVLKKDLEENFTHKFSALKKGLEVKLSALEKDLEDKFADKLSDLKKDIENSLENKFSALEKHLEDKFAQNIFKLENSTKEKMAEIEKETKELKKELLQYKAKYSTLQFQVKEPEKVTFDKISYEPPKQQQKSESGASSRWIMGVYR